MEICKFIATIWSFLLEIALPAATAIFAAAFACQQVKIAKMQRRDNLYDKRYFVYEKFREFARSISDERNNFVLHRKLLREAMLHEFLFNDDIKKFGNETWNKYNTEIGEHLRNGDINFTDNTLPFVVMKRLESNITMRGVILRINF